MSQLLGKILTSTSDLDDPIFHNVKILIVEHNEKGALGFVINKRFERALNELVEFNKSPSFPIYNGGPVDKDHLYFIHQHNERIPDGTKVIDDLFYGGDFKQAINLINNQASESEGVKIFIGYCGWDTNELEDEIAQGSWLVQPYKSELVFAQ